MPFSITELKQRFSHSTPLTREAYSFTPSSDIAIDRLLRNEAPFRQFGTSFAKKANTLIINPWPFVLWSKEELRPLFELLRQLQYEDFSIYLFNGNIFIPYSQKALFSQQDKMCLVHSVDLKAKFSRQYECPYDSLSVFDYPLWQELVSFFI